MLLSRGLDRGIQKTLTSGAAQDPVQGLGIRRKQGYGLWSPTAEFSVQTLQGQHQEDTAFPALLHASPFIKSQVKSPALL